MENNTQSRKWQITINNPIEKGYTHEVIKERIKEMKSVIYSCMSDEVGENGTFHTHIFIAAASAIRFSTIQNRFEGGHFEMANGTSQQNMEYVFKIGKWEKDKKKETNLPETHEEYGELPVERQGARNDINDLYDMIKSGLANYEILESNPQYMMHIDKIERARQIVREEKYKTVWRDIEVKYITGRTGTGKTRNVMEKYGYQNVYRVTDYDHPFDSYKGQDVLVFEEFRSSLKIQDMLNYLDGYPVELPCRYVNKVACYTKVYIITNIDFTDQYRNIQEESPETWKAFKRRIHELIIYREQGKVNVYRMLDYENFIPCLNYEEVI